MNGYKKGKEEAQVAEEANKRLSSKGKASKDLKKATTNDEGRKLTKLIDQALHDIADETEEMGDAKEADCTALRPLALKLAKVYGPCAQVVKKTELMEGVADTHGVRPRRKGGVVGWLIRVLCKLGYYGHGLMASAGVVALLEKHEWPDVGHYFAKCRVWMGACGPKQNR